MTERFDLIFDYLQSSQRSEYLIAIILLSDLISADLAEMSDVIIRYSLPHWVKFAKRNDVEVDVLTEALYQIGQRPDLLDDQQKAFATREHVNIILNQDVDQKKRKLNYWNLCKLHNPDESHRVDEAMKIYLDESSSNIDVEYVKELVASCSPGL